MLHMVLLRKVSQFFFVPDAHIYTVPSNNSAFPADRCTQACNFSVNISDKFLYVQNYAHSNYDLSFSGGFYE